MSIMDEKHFHSRVMAFVPVGAFLGIITGLVAIFWGLNHAKIFIFLIGLVNGLAFGKSDYDIKSDLAIFAYLAFGLTASIAPFNFFAGVFSGAIFGLSLILGFVSGIIFKHFIRPHFQEEVGNNKQKSPGEEDVLKLYVETLEKDPDHFKHYWENPETQVVAFGLGWEVAGSSEDDIWSFKLSLDQQKQPFCWVHPPEPGDNDDFFSPDFNEVQA